MCGPSINYSEATRVFRRVTRISLLFIIEAVPDPLIFKGQGPVMFNTLYPKRLGVYLLTLCILLISGCGITPPDAKVPGSRSLTAEEYVSRYAGNSFKFARGNVGPVNREFYYGEDGTVSVVDLDQESILYGTWTINSALGDNLVMNLISAGFSNGKPYRKSPALITLYSYALPDGTASIFSRGPGGPGIYTEPKPTPGFQAQSRFEAIKRRVDAAFGS